MAAANSACVRLRPAVRRLRGAEQLLLERVGGLLVELLVRLAETGQRERELIGRIGDVLEKLCLASRAV